MFELAEIKEALPKQHRAKVTEEFMATFNGIINDPLMGESYTRNLVTYATVLQDGKYKLNDYFNAVHFVSLKMMGNSSLSAYGKVFPDRMRELIKNNVSQKDMQSHASMYNKTKLVTAIYEQTLIADHIAYASVRHRAIAAQAALLSSTNEHVVQKAADSLMNHLKAPESAKLNIEVGTKDMGVIGDLSAALAKLAGQQQMAISSGMHDAKTIAHSVIIEGELDE